MATWIPVKDRLPEQVGNDVSATSLPMLVFMHGGDMCVAELTGRGKFQQWRPVGIYYSADSPVEVDGIVTHWMPLPLHP